jgi:hypothetical protein
MVRPLHVVEVDALLSEVRPTELGVAAAPESRVVYVDNDPIVMAHARALMTSASEGKTTYVQADLREPETILTHEDVVATLDFDEPVAGLEQQPNGQWR